MTTRKLTKAQLEAELASVTQERDDAWIELHQAQQTITALQQGANASASLARPTPRMIEVQRECTPHGDVLRAGDTVYQASFTERANGAGYKVVAPTAHARDLMASLNPQGVGHLPEHVLGNLLKL